MSSSQIDFVLPKYKIGIISFTDPRSEVKLVGKREEFIKQQHELLVKKLIDKGFTVIDPITETLNKASNRKLFGINSQQEMTQVLKIFLKEKISSLLIGCFAWNEPNLPIALTEKLNCPVALVTTDNPSWPGITALTSTGASFWDAARNKFMVKHQRFILSSNTNFDYFFAWLKATCAINHLKNGQLLLWGGSPALHMVHLNDNITNLENWLVSQIIVENQNILIRRSELILAKENSRIEQFLSWLKNNSCLIVYDYKMITKESLSKQIALYLASKDLINERIRKEERIVGISIKCQPEISIDYGVTACLIPAFLPFSVDNEGNKPLIPTVCEGDIKGLITSILLYALNPSIPPLFGDLKIVNRTYFIIANCGASSAFYGANSMIPEETLSKCSLKPQCQGLSGAAFGYHTPATEKEATYVRLIKIEGRYVFQYGIGKIVKFNPRENDSWGETWPHTAVELKVPSDLLLRALGTNHLSLTLGNYQQEINFIAQLLDIPVVRIDDEKSIMSFINNI
ncbi:MAG: fucose isomerase [Candidatus Heimdallarchaeota archaeon]|nr:fucose isomerase [Candidatus Heimdallarchaeota archaeon]